jgi:SagB-type dehydrogenase family enzyme
VDGVGRRYQRKTAYARGALGGGYLDWASQPSLFKHYRDLPTTDLPGELTPSGTTFREVFNRKVGTSVRAMDLFRLGRILHLAYGITARSGRGRDVHFFRAAPSAGALYPCEIYVSVQGVDGVRDGLHHFDLARNRLCELRRGAFFGETDGWTAVFFITAIFYRSAWKYRDRAYRYCLLDTGHLTENVVLAAVAEGTAPRVFDRFDDERVNRFLGIDPDREACLAAVAVGSPGVLNDRRIPEVFPDFRAALDGTALDPVQPEASAMSPSDRIPPAILQVHRETASWRDEPPGPGETPPGDAAGRKSVRIPEPSPGEEDPPFAQVVWRRRSHRNFTDRGLSTEAFSVLAHSLAHGTDGFSGVSAWFLGAGVESLEAGVYLWDEATSRAVLWKPGDHRTALASACLDQQWTRNAAAIWAFAADLEGSEKVFGPRAYRRAMIQAGRLGQRLYLAATALDLGACGIGAFYDDEARSVLGLPESRDVLYVVATGPVKKMRRG